MKYNGVAKPNKLFSEISLKTFNTHKKRRFFFVLCTVSLLAWLDGKKVSVCGKLNKCKIIVGTHAPKLFPGVGLKLKFDEQKPNKKMRLSVSCREEDRQLMWLWKKCCCSHHHGRLANMCMEYHGCVCVWWLQAWQTFGFCKKIREGDINCYFVRFFFFFSLFDSVFHERKKNIE